MIAFDTNILVYAHDRSDPARRRVAEELVEGTIDGVFLWQVACEFLAASRKLSGQGFTIKQAWHRLEEMFRFMPLVPPTRSLLAIARTLHTEQQWSFWDALIVAACLHAGVARL